MNFNISIIRPKGFAHSDCFREVANSLAWALTALGHPTTVRENHIHAGYTNIILGHNWLSPEFQVPPDTIIYNLEQPSHPHFESAAEWAKRGLVLWEFSKQNWQYWQSRGIDAHHVPIGYTPNLKCIPVCLTPTIDVFFAGWLTPRRVQLIEDLRRAGLTVYACDPDAGMYGGGRDALISLSKVCLNMHHDGRSFFEIVRVSYYLANGKAVASEISTDDDDYEDLKPGILRFSYDNAIPMITSLLENEKWIADLEENGQRSFMQRSYMQYIANALNNDSPHAKVRRRFTSGLYAGDMKDFLPFLRDHAKGDILEIGTRDGASTSAFLMDGNANVISLDIEDCSHLFPGHPNWTFWQVDSQKFNIDRKFDVILVDGDHTREGFRADLDKYWECLKPGGLMLCHDIAPEDGETLEDHPGSMYPSREVQKVYFEFIAEKGLVHEELQGRYGLGALHKPTITLEPSLSASVRSHEAS